MEESREDLIQMQVKGWHGTLHQIDLLAGNDQRICRRIQIEHEVLYSIAIYSLFAANQYQKKPMNWNILISETSHVKT